VQWGDAKQLLEQNQYLTLGESPGAVVLATEHGPEVDVERLTQALTEGCATCAVPGAQLGLLQGGQRLVVSVRTRRVGVASPVGRQTGFHAGSIAKSLTALVVVETARRGELALDVPCGEQVAGLWNDTPSPSASSRCANGRPAPLLPSTAQTRCGQACTVFSHHGIACLVGAEPAGRQHRLSVVGDLNRRRQLVGIDPHEHRRHATTSPRPRLRTC
jgi:Beta-lactamase